MDACFCFSCVCFSLSVLSQEIGWEERLRNDLFVCRVGLFIVHSCFVLVTHPTGATTTTFDFAIVD